MKRSLCGLFFKVRSCFVAQRKIQYLIYNWELAWFETSCYCCKSQINLSLLVLFKMCTNGSYIISDWR